MKKLLFNFWNLLTLEHDPLFDVEFKLEFVRTELLRVNMMIWLILFGCGTGLFTFFFIHEDEVFELIKPIIGSLSLLLMGMLFYELLCRSYILHCLRIKQRLNKWFSFGNLFIEASFPTMIIALFSARISPLIVFISPFILFYCLFIMHSILHLHFLSGLFTGIVSAAEYYLLANFVKQQVTFIDTPALVTADTLVTVRSLIILLCGIAAGFIGIEIKRRIISTYHTITEKNTIRTMFGQQVSHEIVDDILHHGKELVTKRLPLCVMFVDVRNFTPFAASRTPEEVLDYQNKLFANMITAINSNHGIIHQILGDGLMASFGAPFSKGNDCGNAVAAGLEILRTTQKSIDEKEIPPTRLGIGIHFGEAVTGQIGTELRKQYSIVGNVVIQSARIEQLNKQFQSQLLVSRDVFEKITDQSIGESLGMIHLKGEHDPLEIIRIC
ncbi:MAG: adenylate/guanylate cyclase domain-containing protein [Chitinophagales bacterium]